MPDARDADLQSCRGSRRGLADAGGRGRSSVPGCCPQCRRRRPRKHEWIAFTDGGVVLDASWLAGLAQCAGPGIDVVDGNYEPVCDNYFRECAAIAYVSEKDRTGTRGPSLASCLVRRDAFTRAGGFPPFRAAEDLIFIHRLSQGGAGTAFAPNAIVRWQIAGGVAATFRRFESYSYHNLVAGWGRHWHAGTAKLYAGLAVVIIGANLLGGGGWVVPILLAFFVARAGKLRHRKRRSFDFQALAPQRVLERPGSWFGSISQRCSASHAGSSLEDLVELDR